MLPKYGLIGFPLSHSFSKDYFTQKFTLLKVDAVYELFPLQQISDFARLLADEPQLKGLNVTIPFKKEIIPFLDELSDEAREIGAVNTISFGRRNSQTILKGWNTDARALDLELREFTGETPGHALILGTGGAAAAAAYVLKQKGWSYKMLSRNKHGHPSREIMAYNQLNMQIIKSCRLIINASPVGMFPHTNELPDLPMAWINSNHYLFDMVYNPPKTRFLQEGAQRGAHTRNGLGMLTRQADMAWEIWQKESFYEK